MEDPSYLKYVEYFKRQTIAQQYYYRVGNQKSASAKELSKQMGRSIQTVTNALKDLERVGLLISEKKGRVRTYRLKDPRLFKGLTSVYYFKRNIKEDVISKTALTQNLEKWLSYFAKILEGNLYVDQEFHANVLNWIKVNFTIENASGQHLITLFDINSQQELEAAVGKIFSLIHSKDLNPNLTSLFVVCLIRDDPQAFQKMSAQSDLRNLVPSTMGQLSEQATSLGVCISRLTEVVKPEEIAKSEFAENLSAKIVQGFPYYSNEALPGEIWEFGDISSRRNRAFDSIRYKLNNKHRYIFPTLREVLPGNTELKRVLYPESLLHSYGLKEGDTFVDISCFEGLFTLPAAKIVGEKGKVYGIEFSPMAIQKLKNILSENNQDNVVLFNDFPEKVKLESGIADLVFLGTALYDMYDPLKSLKNAHNTLKDSGKLIIVEWKDSVPEQNRRRRDHLIDVGAGPTMQARLNKELVVGFVEEAGFKVITEKDEGFYLYSIVATKK